MKIQAGIDREMAVWYNSNEPKVQMLVATWYATKIRPCSNVCRFSICDSLRGRVQIARLHSIEWSLLL